MAKVVPVSSKTHQNKKLLPLKSFAFAQKNLVVPVIASECAMAARFFPLVFLEQQGECGLYALLGLLGERNLFVADDGRWLADYVPATLRRYPFVFAKAPERDDYILCIDEESGLLSEKEGNALFTAEGAASELLNKALTFVSEYQRGALVSQAFCEEMKRLDLLKPFNIELKNTNDKGRTLTGLLCVDEKKFNALTDEAFNALRAKGYLALVYAHLFSLGSLAGLVRRLSAATAPGSKNTSEAKLPETFSF
ncbi:SapC family protein [Desulfuromonas thiophila]|uniref:SapC family protein n=1 Tax=Desulfuromonas thiophila TaxID=57664 RepID=UPI0024A9963B|nr:SapC family protein [Desulfuromonas thiophila]